MEIKRKFYVFAFTVLGVVLGFFIAEIVQVVYLNLLLANFATYSFGLSWADLAQLYYILITLLMAICGLWGYSSGKYWWNQIYVLKKYDKNRWRHFIK